MGNWNKAAQLNALNELAATVKELTSYLESQPDDAQVHPGTWHFPWTPASGKTAHALRRNYETVLRSILSPGQYILENALAIDEALAITTLLEYGIPDQLDEGEVKSVEELANKNNALSVSRIEVLLRLAASFGIFEEAEPLSGKWRHTPHSLMLRKDSSVPVWALVEYSSGDCLNAVIRLPELCKKDSEHMSGIELLFQKHRFVINAEDSFKAELFNIAMKAASSYLAPGPFEDYDWASLGKDVTVADLGGGIGSHAMYALARHPNLRFIVQDQAHVAEEGRQYWAKHMPKEMNERVEFQAHDFFKPQLMQVADVYYMSSIIHDWDDEDAIKILRALRQSVRPGTKLLDAEVVIKPYNDRYTHTISVHMIVAVAAKERTAEEHTRLLNASGWEVKKIWDTRSVLSIIESVAV